MLKKNIKELFTLNETKHIAWKKNNPLCELGCPELEFKGQN